MNERVFFARYSSAEKWNVPVTSGFDSGFYVLRCIVAAFFSEARIFCRALRMRVCLLYYTMKECVYCVYWFVRGGGEFN